MAERDDFAILIPARKGNGKNMRTVNGKPLIHYACESACWYKNLPIYVSTNCDDIRTYVRSSFPGVLLHDRSEESATDAASTESVMVEFSQRYAHYKNIILLQPTSPLTTYEDIKNAVELYRKNDVNSVVGISWKRRQYEWQERVAGDTEPLFKDRKRRQEDRHSPVENGAIYVTNVEAMLKSDPITRTPYPGKLYPMPEYMSVEADEDHDFVMLEALLKWKNPKV